MRALLHILAGIGALWSAACLIMVFRLRRAGSGDLRSQGIDQPIRLPLGAWLIIAAYIAAFGVASGYLILG